jgi:hypothetical protein
MAPVTELIIYVIISRIYIYTNNVHESNTISYLQPPAPLRRMTYSLCTDDLVSEGIQTSDHASHYHHGSHYDIFTTIYM